MRIAKSVNADPWLHAKLVISGKKLEVYVDDGVEPALVVDGMLDGQGRGTVGVCGWHDLYFTNFRCTPAK